MSYLPECSDPVQSLNPSLLCLSNGHGEDVIAVRILQELQQHSSSLNIAALPLVGEGRAYTQQGIAIIGSVKTMPSGGFIYMDGRELIRDLQGGLLQLTLAQLGAVKSWIRGDRKIDRPNTSPPLSLTPGSQAEPGNQSKVILAVGDIVPLLFAWLSGANYAFVGTAKSEYYLRDENGILPRRSLFARWENWAGSVYLPWERWLMSHPRCKAVFPRDSLTTQTLQKWSIPAFDLGNPMMDRLEPIKPLDCDPKQTLTILLLPGSRTPEALGNWQQIVTAVTSLMATLGDRQLLFLAAIAQSLSLDPFCQILASQNWHQSNLEPVSIQNLKSKIPTSKILTFSKKNASIRLTQHAYNECLDLAQVAIAMAGTATEQFVGLGKPAITFPGKGPQFTQAFAEAQSRHLGASIILVEHPNQVADALQYLLSDPQRLQLIAENGFRRMGKPGAADRIAQCLIEKLSLESD